MTAEGLGGDRSWPPADAEVPDPLPDAWAQASSFMQSSDAAAVAAPWYDDNPAAWDDWSGDVHGANYPVEATYEQRVPRDLDTPPAWDGKEPH